MAFNKDKEISMDIQEGFDFIIEESGNSSINLRKVSWNNRPHKLDIRKWNYTTDGEERAMKGIQLTDDGANELTGVLVEQGYGDTKRIINAIKTREDYNGDFDDSSAEYEDDGSESYYDPKELLG